MKPVRFVVGIVGFGVLMALRADEPNVWMRAGLAGLAGAWLAAFVLVPARRRSELS